MLLGSITSVQTRCMCDVLNFNGRFLLFFECSRIFLVLLKRTERFNVPFFHFFIFSFFRLSIMNSQQNEQKRDNACSQERSNDDVDYEEIKDDGQKRVDDSDLQPLVSAFGAIAITEQNQQLVLETVKENVEGMLDCEYIPLIHDDKLKMRIRRGSLSQAGLLQERKKELKLLQEYFTLVNRLKLDFDAIMAKRLEIGKQKFNVAVYEEALAEVKKDREAERQRRLQLEEQRYNEHHDRLASRKRKYDKLFDNVAARHAR